MTNFRIVLPATIAMIVVFAMHVASHTALADTITFQDGVESYTGTADAYLSETNSDSTYGSEVTVTIDANDNYNNRLEGLLRFDNIFGSGARQIPLGSTITSATLTLTTDGGAGPGDGARFHRLLQSWNEGSVTWNNSFGGNGVDTNGTDALSSYDLDTGYVEEGERTFTMATTSLQAWSDGATNHGWAMPSLGGNGWIIDSSEDGTASCRPKLTVTYVPEPSAFVLLAVGGLALLLVRRWRK